MSQVEETSQPHLQKGLPRSAGLNELLKKDADYAHSYHQLVQDVEVLSPGELKTAYPSEYSSWANRKHWANVHSVKWAAIMVEFQRFLLVNGPIPQESWTLDRIDPKGAYLPENLRWASKSTQSQNRSTSVVVPFRGASRSITEIAHLTGRSYDAVRMGIRRGATAYAAKLLTTVEDNTAEFEEAMWPFPADYRENLEWLYGRRDHQLQNRLQFFIELARRDFYRTEFEASITRNPKVEQSLLSDLAEIRRLHNEAAAYFNELIEREWWRKLGARHQRHYGHVKVPPRPEPDWDGAAEPPPYKPYYL